MPIRILGQTSDRHPPRKWNSPERRKERQKEYIKKHGKPDKKRIQIKPKVSDRMQKLRDNLASVTGGEWGKKSGGRIGLKEGGPIQRKIPQDIRDRLKKLTEKKGRPSPGRPGGKGKEAPDKRWNKGDKFMTPLRAKHGIGSLVKGAKKIITKLKPKGVFKPKPKVDDIDKPFKGYDKSYTKADDKKMDSLLKKLGDEIKAQPIPPKTQKLLKKLQKAYPHKKAAGGRIGLKHGGSVGAAVRGHGAEIK